MDIIYDIIILNGQIMMHFNFCPFGYLDFLINKYSDNDALFCPFGYLDFLTNIYSDNYIHDIFMPPTEVNFTSLQSLQMELLLPSVVSSIEKFPNGTQTLLCTACSHSIHMQP